MTDLRDINRLPNAADEHGDSSGVLPRLLEMDFMVKVTFVEHNGEERSVEGVDGASLMETALTHGVPGILADCGGALSCATCHVYIRPEWTHAVGGPGAEEEAMLEMAIDPGETSRLSCCVRLTAALDGLVVDLPAAQI